ncbi:hypothetical protein V5799_008597 [Amblyomma americanum]|uniref:Uncharacterized protein n=1 Tax=Amblyomma americanum TaxID=6943 RepID=A0AAQ4FDJ8_AMBAM
MISRGGDWTPLAATTRGRRRGGTDRRVTKPVSPKARFIPAQTVSGLARRWRNFLDQPVACVLLYDNPVTPRVALPALYASSAALTSTKLRRRRINLL